MKNLIVKKDKMGEKTEQSKYQQIKSKAVIARLTS